MNEIIDSLVEVELAKDEYFLVIKETLSRIGMAARGNVLYQSCHILHKRGRYYIVHFKEMFMLDGEPSSFSEEDCARRNKIIELLQEWKLIRVKRSWWPEVPPAPMKQIKVVRASEKADWQLETKYTFGRGIDDV
jgi:hypothetical protein